MKSGKRENRFAAVCGAMLLAACGLIATQGTAWAQSAGQGESMTAGAAPGGSEVKTSSDAAARDHAEILKELEQMRARIQELEAQLQRQSGGAASGSATTALASPSYSTSATAAVTPQEGSQPGAPASSAKPAKSEPFAWADWSWLNGNPRIKEVPFDTKFFTPEIRADADYIYDFNHPSDNTIGGSSEVFRANEVQVTQLGVGGDFHYDHVRARLMTQFGMYSVTTPRNDASPARGQWDLADAYRYVSEAYGGYHFDALHGINVDAGIFMSYVGLFSYYNFDNWAYQPSYVSSNTPWFFNGVRVQIYPTDKLKIEPWFTNGWQSYGKFNKRPGIGMQILYRPTKNWSILGNQYMLGRDALGVTGRTRFHTDDSIQYKYYENPGASWVSKAAASLTIDLGCESGGGVACFGHKPGIPRQTFMGFMFYNRLWLHRDLFGLTIGGGAIDNPGRYLVLLPPINGATAASGTPYFTENPGDSFRAWDVSTTFDYMPSQYITFRWEYNHRATNVPYWSGGGGITPPGGNTGAPGSVVPGFTPDLRKRENRLNMSILVMF